MKTSVTHVEKFLLGGTAYSNKIGYGWCVNSGARLKAFVSGTTKGSGKPTATAGPSPKKGPAAIDPTATATSKAPAQKEKAGGRDKGKIKRKFKGNVDCEKPARRLPADRPALRTIFRRTASLLRRCRRLRLCCWLMACGRVTLLAPGALA